MPRESYNLTRPLDPGSTSLVDHLESQDKHQLHVFVYVKELTIITPMIVPNLRVGFEWSFCTGRKKNAVVCS